MKMATKPKPKPRWERGQDRSAAALILREPLIINPVLISCMAVTFRRFATLKLDAPFIWTYSNALIFSGCSFPSPWDQIDQWTVEDALIVNMLASWAIRGWKWGHWKLIDQLILKICALRSLCTAPMPQSKCKIYPYHLYQSTSDFCMLYCSLAWIMRRFSVGNLVSGTLLHARQINNLL